MFHAITDAEALDAIPPHGLLHRYVKYCRTQTDASTGFHIGAGLAMLATLSPTQGFIYRNGKEQRFNIYTMLVGDSVTARKSTSIELMTSVLRPAAPDRFVSTPESWPGLLKALETCPNGQGVVIEPEFSRFLASAKGTGYLAPLKLGYTDIYDGSTVSRSTVSEQLSIASTSLSMLAGVAPPHIEDNMTPTDFSGGFWARFMVLFGDSVASKERRGEPRIDMLAYLRRCARFYATQVPSMWNGEFKVSPEAGTLLWQYGERSTLEARAMAPSDIRRGVVGRSGLVVAKAACLFAFDRMMYQLWMMPPDERAGISERPIEVLPVDVTYGMRVAQLHIKSAVMIAQSIAGTENMRARRRVYDAVLARMGKPVSLGQITRAAGLLVREVRPILETLMAEDLIRKDDTDLEVERYTITVTAEQQQANDARRREAELTALRSNIEGYGKERVENATRGDAGMEQTFELVIPTIPGASANYDDESEPRVFHE